ncbi:MAG: hypothetical protein QNJ44_18400 [Rhodobacter sp.]|nr:hypothetical protein [Rhodobacter sp.]
MAFHSDTYPSGSGAVQRIAARTGEWLASLGRSVFIARAAEARVHEMERLMAKSDAELAEIGLRREDVARHVFRDILHL